MPWPRILGVAALAMLLMLAALWAMNVNYAAWLGIWLAAQNQYSAGGAVILVLGVAMAWLYTNVVGDKFPGPGPLRGLMFGAVLWVGAVWVLPYTLEGIAGAIGNTQVVYGGYGVVRDEKRTDEKMQEAVAQVEPCPELFGVKPPLAKLTRDKDWAPADAWKARLLPFGIAFLLYGLVLGAFLSQDPNKH
ncbi:MAG: hypothetical protein IT463_05695 [Planctomycetes bacterium]|nr:hypothetical protein [Planctomycetota bacterium]